MSGSEAPRWWSVAVGAAALILLLIAGLGGGGRGGLGDTAAQLLALGVLALLALQAAMARLRWNSPRWAPWLVVLVLALPLIQLMPVPSGLWAAGAARTELAAQLATVGVSAWPSLSLGPLETERALLWLLPACAIFLASLTLPLRARLALIGGLLALAVFNILLGMAQLADGRESTLRFHWPTNVEHAVGFFANRNHLASLLVMALPIAIFLTSWALVGNPRARWRMLGVAAGCGLVVLLIIGVSISGSRAGLLLAMLGMLGAWPVVMGLRKHRGAHRVLVLTLAVAVVLAVQFSMLGVLKRLGGDRQEEGRWEYARVTLEAATAYLPWGSGIGTFQQAYQPFEARGQPGSSVINHAHNDYLELWLEGGILALLLMIAALGCWLARGWTLFRMRLDPDSADTFEWRLAQIAWISGSMALLHSALDYPLRTTAAMTAFALVAAIAFGTTKRRRASRTEIAPADIQ